MSKQEIDADLSNNRSLMPSRSPLLIDGHIFTIKTKDATNIAGIKAGGNGIVISGLNVLKDQISVGDFVFVVFGGDKPKGWKPGLVGLAHIARPPFDEGYEGKNFRVAIDVDIYFEPSIVRGDLVTYPDTFDTIGIGPITKWEPNQAITSVQRKNAIALLHAICDLRPNVIDAVKSLLGVDFADVGQEVCRYVIAKSKIGHEPAICSGEVDFQHEFITWWCDIKKRAEKTARNYIGYLASLNKPLGEKTNSTWPGVYVYLFGKKSSKEVVQVGALDQFDEIFGPFCRIFDDSGCPEGADPDAYANCVQWIKDVSQWACLSSAFKAYREFLEWRDEQNKAKDEPLPANVDRLDVALKMFAEKRAVDKPSGWDSYDAWTHGVRTDFVAVDESLLANPAFDYLAYIRKFAISWQVANTKFASHSDDEKHAVLKFLKEHKDSPKPASWYIDVANRLGVGGNQVKGMSPKAVLYFMSELHPEEFSAWTEPTYEQLAYLGLHKGAAPNDLTIETYEDCKSKQQQIVARMKELGIGKASDDPSAPDYRTVNEFLWWLGQDANKDLIKEEIMSKAMKPADYSTSGNQPKAKKPKVNLSNAEDVVLLRLAAALRAKPFAILAGHSGTGKSRMVRKLAYMTYAKGGYKALLEGADGKPAATPGNFCMVQVKPNWHDSTDLLGYYSEIGSAFRTTDFVKFICKAYAYPDVPFFVCLDEMNLAPVEQYFAEYLSAIESRKVKDDAEFLDGNGDEKTGPKVITDTLLDKSVWKSASDLGCEFTQSAYWVEKHGLTIPRNLFVVGTVNMDESTNQFSRKVLDRAFTLEMTDADFEHFGEQSPEPSYDDYAGDKFVEELLAGKLFASDLTADHKLKPTQVTNLNKLKPILADTSFVVAYRFANEYALYEDALEKMLLQFDSSTGAGGASAGTSSGAAEAPAADGATQSATGTDGAEQPAAADGTQQSGAEGAGNSQGAASPSAKPEAFDDMILMKLLPRITGDAELVLKIFAGDENAKLDDANVKGLAGLLEKKGASFKKMKEIVKRGGTSLTFWP